MRRSDALRRGLHIIVGLANVEIDRCLKPVGIHCCMLNRALSLRHVRCRDAVIEDRPYRLQSEAELVVESGLDRGLNVPIACRNPDTRRPIGFRRAQRSACCGDCILRSRQFAAIVVCDFQHRGERRGCGRGIEIRARHVAIVE